MKLIQIPFSHNCVKARKALELKGLAYETLDIAPMDRDSVFAASGQRLVPALIDGDRSVADSSAILRYLEETYPDPSLLPPDPSQHAECWLIEDWACARLMEMTRRLAYWQVLSIPDRLPSMFFPDATGLRKKLMTAGARRVLTKRFRLSASRNRRDEQIAPQLAQLFLDRLGKGPYLFGDRPTVADLSVAALSAPLRASAPAVLEHVAVRRLLEWTTELLGQETVDLYKP